jgi:peptidoglycan/LPS O-acetylase OafA/YrhL
MKKTVMIFVVAGLVLAGMVGLFFSMPEADKSNPIEILPLVVMLILVVFALLLGFKRLSSARRGEPAEDELSKQVKQRAASLSYYISLYFWVFLLFIKDRINFDQDQLLGTGIVGMGIIFAFAWLILNFRGVRNE